MKVMKLYSNLILTFLLVATAQLSGQGILNKANDFIKNQTKAGASPLSSEEIAQGLKEALKVGTDKSASNASKIDGFLKNPAIFIPFPPEAQKMKKKLIDLGQETKVNEFETSLNRAAEEAAKSAGPIFVNAITGMSISDGLAILKGNDTAATNYLRQKTYNELVKTFQPTVKKAIEKVEVTKYWTPLVNTYNKIPMVEKQNPDLEIYVTQLAVQGLFKLIKNEEASIRKDPAARVNDILKKVFGSKEAQGK